MELWYPPTDRPHLLEWWRPLMLASRNARLERFPWPIHLDEWTLVGRVDRPSRPAIWVYRHAEGRGEVYVDHTGQAYKYTRTPNSKGHGRFTPCEIRTALWRAGLPTVVQPIWFDDPGPRGPAWDGGHAEDLEDDDLDQELDEDLDEDQVTPPPAPRRRGHLTILDGGGHPMAG